MKHTLKTVASEYIWADGVLKLSLSPPCDHFTAGVISYVNNISVNLTLTKQNRNFDAASAGIA
jgi:hypothetical protein